MVLKLYGTPISALRVAVVLHEKKVPFELVKVDRLKNEHKSPEHLKKMPFGQTPYIDDDGFILYESRAIGRYLEAKYPHRGTSLIPTDLHALALFEQACSIEAFNFDPYASKAAFEMVYKPYLGMTPDKAAFDGFITELSAKLDVYDVILGKQRYLAGDEITLADLFHLPYGSRLAIAGSDVIESRPNVARWFKELSSRPSWIAVKDGAKSTCSYEFGKL